MLCITNRVEYYSYSRARYYTVKTVYFDGTTSSECVFCKQEPSGINGSYPFKLYVDVCRGKWDTHKHETYNAGKLLRKLLYCIAFENTTVRFLVWSINNYWKLTLFGAAAAADATHIKKSDNIYDII